MRKRKYFCGLISIIFTLLLISACSGSGGSGGAINVSGVLGARAASAARLLNQLANIELATFFSGVEVCCGGQCDLTNDAGEFNLSIDAVDSVLCSLNNPPFSGQEFVIDGFESTPGDYIIIVDAFENSPDDYTITIDLTRQMTGTGTGDGDSSGDNTGNGDSGGDDTSTTCGDDVADEGEECDGTDLGGLTCTDQGFIGGDLFCNADCTFDSASCTAETEPVCGNGIVESGEDCDGGDIAGNSCEDFGFTGGELNCSIDCTFEESLCTSEPSCSEEEKVCDDNFQPPSCSLCSCNDGFELDCNQTCADTESLPEICVQESCSPGHNLVCPQ